MNSVLEEILESGQVSDGQQILPLTSCMDKREGDLLARVIDFVRPTTSLEVGFAYGVSTLFICEALSRIGKPARHIVVDPYQWSEWRGIGLRNIKRAGYEAFVELRQQESEISLPQLVEEKTILDLALIDGWHTFD